MEKIVYAYDSSSYEYTGSIALQESPLEPGVYVGVDFTTDKKPVFGGGEWPVYDPAQDIWLILPDHRGIILYSKVDGSLHVISQLGAWPDDLVMWPRPNVNCVWSDEAGDWVEVEASIPDVPNVPVTVKAYGYNPNTLHYLGDEFGVFTLQASPLEPGKLVEMAYTTLNRPLIGKDQWAVYDEAADDWLIVPDYRGQVFYAKDSGARVEINELGALPDALTSTARPSSAHDWSEEAGGWVENSERAQALENERLTALQNEAVEAVRSALQAAIDLRFAQVQQDVGTAFDTEDRFLRYCGYPNAFREAAERYGAWTADVWDKANKYKAQVLAGQVPMLSPQQAVEMMPAYPGA